MTTIPREAGDVVSSPVCVEALLLRCDADGELTYRRLVTALDRGAAPDRTVKRLARLGDGADGCEPHLVHSTSWRACDDGRIVLTYVVHPDPEPDRERPGTVLSDRFAIARSARPADPAPPELRIGHVVAHAVRHLAFLDRTDPVVAAHLAAWPNLRRVLDGVPGATAGELQDA